MRCLQSQHYQKSVFVTILFLTATSFTVSVEATQQQELNKLTQLDDISMRPLSKEITKSDPEKPIQKERVSFDETITQKNVSSEKKDNVQDLIKKPIEKNKIFRERPENRTAKNKKLLSAPKKDITEKDFGEVNDDPTKAQSNDVSTDTSSDAMVRINEVLPNPIGKDSGHEYIELYNYGDETIILDNWSLCDKKKCTLFKNTVTLASGAYKSFYNKIDFSFALNNRNEKIYLKNHNDIEIDSFVYASSKESMSWNYDDMWYEESPTPDKKNNENPAAKSYNTIIINEVLPNPIGKDADGEFIELYNPGTEDVSLAQWSFTTEKINGNLKTYMLPQDASIAAKSFIIFKKNIRKLPFTLLNSALTIRLHAPNGTIKSHMMYKDAPEGASYNLDSDAWRWSTLLTPLAKNDFPQNLSTIVYPPLLLNELSPYPTEAHNEFIEIYNPTDRPIDLDQWVLRDASKNGRHTFGKEIIPAHDYHVITKNVFGFALNNSTNETVFLIAPNGKTVDAVSYLKAFKNMNYARSNTLWKWTPVSTPLAKNTFLHDNIYPKLLITEILPNPTGNEGQKEFIELYNPTNVPQSLKYWTLHDSSAMGTYTFDNTTIIAPYEYVVIYRTIFNFALNNSAGESVSLVAPNGTTTSALTYTISPKEGISYAYDFSHNNWHWTKTQTPRAQNIFDEKLSITTTTIDENIYKNVFSEFSVKTNAPEDTIKVRWDFGDGHKSYSKSARHRYMHRGVHTVSVRVSNNIEEITTEFKVDVKSYPNYDVRIVVIAPNPDGKDYANEYITILNNDHDTIDFTGWSIATGKNEMQLVNHPFRKELILRAGDVQKIQSSYAAISLPNKGGVVALRAPNGNVVDTTSYQYNDGTTIPSDGVYAYHSDGWSWAITPQKNKPFKNSKKELSLWDQNIIIKNARDNMLIKPSSENKPVHHPKITTNFVSPAMHSVHVLNHTFRKIILSLPIITAHAKTKLHKPYHSLSKITYMDSTHICSIIPQDAFIDESIIQKVCDTLKLQR